MTAAELAHGHHLGEAEELVADAVGANMGFFSTVAGRGRRLPRIDLIPAPLNDPRYGQHSPRLRDRLRPTAMSRWAIGRTGTRRSNTTWSICRGGRAVRSRRFGAAVGVDGGPPAPLRV
ncbi:hypothetical protein HLB23_05590 [Nocardia uniformis]|uniref:Uncharacterized protein n=1 Tax=Nocardia uniformis TaxID=53432 RepID=A0A849BW51_9NOCA|nr:hypothetical protein [Nocardia uniformis]NNH69348.1 hypothetical protein [Nocardia uniformis]